MVGSALLRRLSKGGYQNIVLKTRQELDLLDQPAVNKFFQTEQPDYVFIAAAKVGGINANNTYPAEFIYQNLVIETNIIQAAFKSGVQDLMFLGSSCIYPRDCHQPISEDYLLTGSLEPTNEAYAIAKIAGVKLCESYHRQYQVRYTSVIPANLYGPNDNFNIDSGHVIASLIRKMHLAKLAQDKTVTCWGSGKPLRDFISVDDAADACVFIMENLREGFEEGDHRNNLTNIGTGTAISILELAETIKTVVGYHGGVQWDTSKPDGMPCKSLDCHRLNALGWVPKTSLKEGLTQTYEWFLQQC